MNALAALRSAWRALTTQLLRSMLTMLGIIIGVAAVITMIAIGAGAQERVVEHMKSLGTNVMLVMPGSQSAGGVRMGAQTGQMLTEDDAAAIARDVPEVQVAAPASRTTTQVVAGNTNWLTYVIGTTNDFLEAREWTLEAGRAFEAGELQGSGKVGIIGRTAARELFGDEDPLEQIVRVRNVPITIVGLLAPKGENANGQDQDDMLVVPITTLRNRIQGGNAGKLRRIGWINVKVREGQSMKDAEDGIRELLRQRHRVQPGADDSVRVRNLTEVLQAQEASSRVMTLLLGAVAGVSLVVGGIGIMNIMLVSVTERTREIGIRQAVGATPKDIRLQFLTEALMLSIVGGLIGTVVGVGGAYLFGALSDMRTVVSVSSIFLAFGSAAIVGAFFGYYPANQAAQLDPIEALRYE